MPAFSDDFRFFVGLASAGALGAMGLLVLYLSVRSFREMFRAEVRARFADRTSLSLDDFYTQFYAAKNYPRSQVLEVLTGFARAAGVPSEYVKPDDTFASLGATNASAAEKYAVDTVVLIKEAEQRFHVSLFEGTLNTLDDYVRVTILATRLAEKGFGFGPRRESMMVDR
jgi:hypothetical protein